MSKRILTMFMIIFVIFLYAPTLLLPVFAFNDSSIIAFPLSGFTFDWFKSLGAADELRKAAGTSLIIATSSSIIATMLALLATSATVRYKFPGKGAGFEVDVAHPCSQSVSKWQLAGLIEPLDTSRIDRWDDVNEVKETFAIDGEYYMLPTDWGTTSLVYRTDLVDASKMDNLQVFLDPEFEGRASLPNNVDDIYALAFLATGVTDWTEATQEQFEAASAWLRQAHPNVVTYWADGAELAQLMTTGEASVAWAWNETPTTLIGEGIPVEINRETTEGSSSWFCGYVNVVNGPNSEDLMYDFLNAWMEPASAEYIVNEWGYGHGNQTAVAALGAETLDGVGLGPVSAPVLAQAPLDNQMREQMIVEFEKIKAGF